MKISIIGGGSTYTPELVYGIIKDKDTLITSISLQDIDPQRLEINAQYCRALALAGKSSVEIASTLSLEEALDSSHFVVTQIRAGGNTIRAQDEERSCRMGWVAQETTGAVGLLKALRTIPILTDIVKTLQKVSPKAFLINFTNPAGITSSAVYQLTDKKNMAGLCNVPIFMKNKLTALIKDHLPHLLLSPSKTAVSLSLNKAYKDIAGVNKEESLYDNLNDITLIWGGLNHLSWVFDILREGVSIKGEILNFMTSKDFDLTPYFPINKDYAKRTNTIPSPYLRYFTDTNQALEEQKTQQGRGSRVMEIEKNLLEIYKRETQIIMKEISQIEEIPSLPAELSERGGADYSRLAVNLIKDLSQRETRRGLHILNVPDQEEIFGSSDYFCEIPVETNCSKLKDSCRWFIPRYPSPRLIDNEIMDLIKSVRHYEELVIEAAVSKNLDAAVAAAEANPLIPISGKIREFLKESNIFQ